VTVAAPSTATWRALGTGVRLVVSEGDLDAARSAVETVLRDVDLAYSRFRPDSEISRLNERAGTTVAISALFADAIVAALDAAERTGGAVDPTVGRAMRAIGYDVDFDLVPRQDGPIHVRLEPVPGWRTVDLSVVRSEVRIPEGVELDLGSTGKGLAADRAAAAALRVLSESSDRGRTPAPGVLVSLGGDIAVAGEAPPDGWRILLAEDSETPPDAGGEVVAIDRGGLATSSTTVRRWTRGGITYHHLVDPWTGASVRSPWRTATVVAATCVEANAAATAAIVLGTEAPAWLDRMGLPARLVAVDGEILRLRGWPAPD
jgi:thiamine biosynthesis lipoprotein ApbE